MAALPPPGAIIPGIAVAVAAAPPPPGAVGAPAAPAAPANIRVALNAAAAAPPPNTFRLPTTITPHDIYDTHIRSVASFQGYIAAAPPPPPVAAAQAPGAPAGGNPREIEKQRLKVVNRGLALPWTDADVNGLVNRADNAYRPPVGGFNLGAYQNAIIGFMNTQANQQAIRPGAPPIIFHI